MYIVEVGEGELLIMDVIIKLAIVLFGFSFTRADDDIVDLLLKETSTTSLNFNCTNPQSRAVRISSLVTSQEHDTFIPTHVILDRCDDMTGVCKAQNHVCAPLEPTTKVKIAFIRLNLPLNIVEKHILEVDNHSQCGCMKSENPIK